MINHCYSNNLNIDINYTNFNGSENGIRIYDGELSYSQTNISENPLFCDPINDNYALAENSPCIGSGENGQNMGYYDVSRELLGTRSRWHATIQKRRRLYSKKL